MPELFWLPLALSLLLPVYLYVEATPGRPWQKLALKALCSALFTAMAFLAALHAPNGWRGWHGMFLLAFLCCLAGDVLLALPGDRCFAAGLGVFFAAQCAFAEAFTARWGLSPWDSAAFAALAGVSLLLIAKGPGLSFGPMKFAACLYALALSAMAAKAASGVWIAGFARAWPAALGGLLFFASDAALVFLQFGSRKPVWLRVLNLTAYYAGQALLAMSLYA